MKDWKYDFYRMTGSKFQRNVRCCMQYLFSHQIRYMRLWRSANTQMTVFRRLRLLRYARKYGLEISPKAYIGKGLYLGHPYNITVAGG